MPRPAWWYQLASTEPSVISRNLPTRNLTPMPDLTTSSSDAGSYNAASHDLDPDAGLCFDADHGLSHDTHGCVANEAKLVFQWLGPTDSDSECSVVDDPAAGEQQIHETGPCVNAASLRYDTHGNEREHEMSPLCYKYHWLWLSFGANLLLNSPGYQWIRDASGSQDDQMKQDVVSTHVLAATSTHHSDDAVSSLVAVPGRWRST